MTKKTFLLSSRPEELKEEVFSKGRAIVEVDKLENDLTRTCGLGQLLVVEPGRPPFSAAKRYIVGINNKLVFTRLKQKYRKDKVYILGIGEANINDLTFWCNAKKIHPTTTT